jgi:hypothetical protein
MPRKSKAIRSSPAGSILQLKVRLPGISPIIWRRVLVPASARSGSSTVSSKLRWARKAAISMRFRSAPFAMAATSSASHRRRWGLESARFRENAKIIYVYDTGAWWQHEIRIEDRIEAEARKALSALHRGAGACPPEDCGGTEGYQHAARKPQASMRSMWGFARRGDGVRTEIQLPKLLEAT